MPVTDMDTTESALKAQRQGALELVAGAPITAYL